MGKRRAQYEEALSADPLDYDTWFDYARLEEAQVRIEGTDRKTDRPVFWLVCWVGGWVVGWLVGWVLGGWLVGWLSFARLEEAQVCLVGWSVKKHALGICA